MTSFKWLWSISTVQQESAHCPHTHTYSQMHQQTNKLVNQIWTETITRHWWSPVISAAFLLFISVMIIRGLTSTRHFCNQPSHNIFLQHDRSCCHVNFRGFFFLQLQAGTVRNSYSASAHCNFSTSDQLVKRCSCSASLRAPRMSDPGRSRRPEERPKRLCIWSLMWWLRKNGRKKVIQGSEKYFELTRNILPGNAKMIAK